MNQGLLLTVMFISSVLWGCNSRWVHNDEYGYLHQPVESTPELLLPEGSAAPAIEPYMPLPDASASYPAVSEEVDFKPPTVVKG